MFRTTHRSVVLLLAFGLSAGNSVVADDNKGSQPLSPTNHVIRLFNGKDLTGFVIWLQGARHEDSRRVFSVRNGMLHISGDALGYIRTKQAYRNYHLIIEFKWGQRTWGKRKKRSRDTGIIVHCTGPEGGYGGVFMAGIEAQIIEGGCGDFIVVPCTRKTSSPVHVSLSAEVVKDRDGEAVWKKGGPKRTFTAGRVNWFGRDPDWDEGGIPLTGVTTTCSVSGHGRLSRDADGVRKAVFDGRGLPGVPVSAPVARRVFVSALWSREGLADGRGVVAVREVRLQGFP